MLRQLSYPIKNQLKAPEAPFEGHFLSFTGSFWHKGGFHTRIDPIRVDFHSGQGSITDTPVTLVQWHWSLAISPLQDSQDRGLWQLSVSLASGVVHQYRYCVVVILQVNRMNTVNTVNTD